MNFSRDDVFERTQQILIELFELEAPQIQLSARLYEDLDIDSIDAVDLLIELKRFTGKNVKPDQFKQARTVQDIVDIVVAL